MKNLKKYFWPVIEVIVGILSIWGIIYFFNELPNCKVDNFLYYIISIVFCVGLVVVSIADLIEFLYENYISKTKFYQRLKDKYGYLLNDEDDNELYSKK